MSEHTPSPWRLEEPEDGGRVLACDDRETIVHVPNCSPFNEQGRADARLIAAAPDMLAELRRMHEKHGEQVTADVIAKAEGL